MGSAFPAEPREWFAGEDDTPVMFLMWIGDERPVMVAHAHDPKCGHSDYPHTETECGLLQQSPERI
jgi:hypothetical protein